MAPRILGSLGRFLITTGVVVLLFAAYQLWGTGLHEAAAQNDLGSEFEALLDDVQHDNSEPVSTETGINDVLDSSTTTTVVPVPTTTTEPIPEAGGTIPVADAALAEKLFREGGEAIARITIPELSVDKIVVQGVQVDDLRNGPGHYRSTVFPGQAGNSGIAGHRTTYGAPFNRIDELVPGDEIRVTTVQGDHLYRVLPAGEAYSRDAIGSLPTDFEVPSDGENLGHIIVRPTDTWVLADFGDYRITLTACHPKYSARERIIVAAELVSDAVDAPQPPQDYETNDNATLAEEGRVDQYPQDIDELPNAPGLSASADEPDVSTAGRNDVRVTEVSLDAGLDGEKDALRPAIFWGVMATASYLAAKTLARRWKRWPALALGILPVAYFLSKSFEKIDRYLPAG